MRIFGKLILCLLWCRMFSSALHPSDEDRRLLRWIRSSTFLQMEFFTMASGNYLAFPAAHREPREELAFHTICRSVSYLWTQLSSMRQIDRTLDEVTREVSSILKDLLHYRNAVNFVCQKLDTIVGDDPKLGPLYAQLKRNVSGHMEKVFFWESLDDVGTLAADKMASWLSDLRIRRLLLNGDFLSYAKGANFETDFGLIAESIFKMAEQRAQHVQRLYDEALTEAAAEINSDLDFRQPISVLFEKLRKKFESDDRFVELLNRSNVTSV